MMRNIPYVPDISRLLEPQSNMPTSTNDGNSDDYVAFWRENGGEGEDTRLMGYGGKKNE